MAVPAGRSAVAAKSGGSRSPRTPPATRAGIRRRSPSPRASRSASPAIAASVANGSPPGAASGSPSKSLSGIASSLSRSVKASSPQNSPGSRSVKLTPQKSPETPPPQKSPEVPPPQKSPETPPPKRSPKTPPPRNHVPSKPALPPRNVKQFQSEKLSSSSSEDWDSPSNQRICALLEDGAQDPKDTTHGQMTKTLRDSLGGQKGKPRLHKNQSASASGAEKTVTKKKTRSKREVALLRLAPKIEDLEDLAWLNLQSPVPAAADNRLKKMARPLRRKVKSAKEAMKAKSLRRNEYSSGDEKYYII